MVEHPADKGSGETGTAASNMNTYNILERWGRLRERDENCISKIKLIMIIIIVIN